MSVLTDQIEVDQILKQWVARTPLYQRWREEDFGSIA